MAPRRWPISFYCLTLAAVEFGENELHWWRNVGVTATKGSENP
jgi:hypothetical protein